MRETLEQPPIASVYTQAAPNDTIDFGRIQVSIPGEVTDAVMKTGANVKLSFIPHHSLYFDIPREDQSLWAQFQPLPTGLRKVSIDEFGSSIDVFAQRTVEAGIRYKPNRSPVQTRKNCDSIQRAVFHLFNWPDFCGPDDFILALGQPPRQGLTSLGRFNLRFNNWDVSVCEIHREKESLDALDNGGGYLITHLGSVERADKSEFSSADLDEILSRLMLLFSFALGRWSAPSLTVGYDSIGVVAYEQLGLGRVDDGAWKGSFSWFDEHHSELLGEVGHGFWNLSERDIWKKPLHEALYWYIQANKVGSGLGVDSALLFTQAALELLAWNYCVRDRKMVSPRAFLPGKLTAADKLRLLVSSLGIPLEIPVQMTALHSKPGKKWEDSMDVITDLRNGLVHPTEDRRVPDGAYAEAWKLSMWYLDLILLRLCGHSGKYANRLATRYVGQVEQVPWKCG